MWAQASFLQEPIKQQRGVSSTLVGGPFSNLSLVGMETDESFQWSVNGYPPQPSLWAQLKACLTKPGRERHMWPARELGEQKGLIRPEYASRWFNPRLLTKERQEVEIKTLPFLIQCKGGLTVQDSFSILKTIIGLMLTEMVHNTPHSTLHL